MAGEPLVVDSLDQERVRPEGSAVMVMPAAKVASLETIKARLTT